MFYAILKTIHLLSIIVWIGGMAFAHFFLRPSVATLETPERVRLMHAVLGRFFNAVLVAGGLALGSGLWMMGRIAKQTVQAGGKLNLPLEWMVMAVLGVVMLAIFGYTRCALPTSHARCDGCRLARGQRRAGKHSRLGDGESGDGRGDCGGHAAGRIDLTCRARRR